MGGSDDIVLNAKILEQEFHWLVVVRFDSADFCSRKNHDLRFLFRKERRNGCIVTEIKLAPIALDQVGKTSRFERARERAAHHSAVTCDKHFL